MTIDEELSKLVQAQCRHKRHGRGYGLGALAVLHCLPVALPHDLA